MKNKVQIKDLTVSFNNHEVLSHLVFNLPSGMKTVICGPNGSGKTTLFRCILGLIEPQSGSIEVNAEKIAYCKQDMPEKTFPISAREVVGMGIKHIDTEKIRKVMELTGTYALSDKSFFKLSGGERQRVSLARCLYGNADLILLDEPSSFLDKESENTILNVLKNLPDDISAMVISHDEDFIRKLSWQTFDIRKLQK